MVDVKTGVRRVVDVKAGIRRMVDVESGIGESGDVESGAWKALDVKAGIEKGIGQLRICEGSASEGAPPTEEALGSVEDLVQKLRLCAKAGRDVS